VGRGQSIRPTVQLSIAFLLAACTPATTRPPFGPYPEAHRAVLNVRAARVVTEAQEWLNAQGAPVAHASPLDGFLETKWHDAVDSAGVHMTVKVRVWADPDVPGKSRVTVEAVYQPVEDPSRAPRDLERPAPAGSAGERFARRLLAALTEKLGQTVY
jgi:hypothetical protein